MSISNLTQSNKDWQRYKKGSSKRRIHSSGSFPSGEKPKRKRRKNMIKRIITWLIVLGIVAALIGGISFIGLLAWYSGEITNIENISDRIVAESTKIYDRSGEHLLWEIHGDEKRTTVELENISPYIIKATISAEDKHFYEHKGINIFSVIQAVIIDPLLGRGIRGGSTLTQQFVKNAILTNERTIERKLKEWILAYKIEQKYSKDQILKMYFNQIPYGSVNYGVESAANYFFGKAAKDITLAEAAILAAIPQAPTRLSPYGSHTDQLIARQRWILDEMVGEGYITKEEASEAKNQELIFKKEQISGINAPHFVFYVKELLSEELGQKTLEQGGLKVLTTLDWEKQQAAEQVVADNVEHINNYGANNAALVSVDAKTGEILAMVGSVDFSNEEIDGEVNVAIRPRQPGSSGKPIAYAAAIEKGFTTETVVYDVNTSFPTPTGPYAPKNYDKGERGPITFRRALGGSLNIPAVKALYLAGVQNVIELMQSMGYSTITDETDCGLSLVLGGCEVKLLDHVGAFTAFARDGERAETAAILKVENHEGKVLSEFKPKLHQVMSKQTARAINSILSDDSARAWVFGGGSKLTLPDRPVAAKTGTTNDNNDGWTIGYTPSIVTGVWVGNSDGKDMNGNATGYSIATPIWNGYMKKVLTGTPVESFKTATGVKDDMQGVLKGETQSEVEVEIDKASKKLATPLTPDSFKETKKFRADHSILYYVDKDNPQGQKPEDPSKDPMYNAWEESIENWLQRQAEEKGEEYSRELPPQEFDDLHVLENIPTISLISPQNGQTLTEYPITFDVRVNAPRGVNRVTYELNNQVIGVSAVAPYSLTVNGLDTTNGYQTLKVTAYDDIDNSNSIQIELNVKLPYTAPLLNWLNPRDKVNISRSWFPLTIDLSLDKTTTIEKITFYYESNTQAGQQFAQILELPSKNISINWPNSPGQGEYQIYAIIKEKDGKTTQTDNLTINIIE